MENIYTKENWAQDGSLKVKVGQYVADDVIEERYGVVVFKIQVVN